MLFHRLELLIAARTGLQLWSRERGALRDTLAARVAALQLSHADDYRQLLQSDTQVAHSEWEHLFSCLTNNETYFFRDRGQMALLRDHILPELISRNQATRRLRIWSAGCSTGEEPYSLATLVNELLPRRGASSGPEWDTIILGTDIDGQALQQARRGIYGSWSLRMVEPALQQHYFHRVEGGWQVAGSSRSLVTFGVCNLVRDHFPGKVMGLYDMDLILCRNVFIYFEPDAVSAVLSKFAKTLRDGGYLMTGHTETVGKLVAPLQARSFPQSVIYQRITSPSVGVSDITAPGTTVAGPALRLASPAGVAHASIDVPPPQLRSEHRTGGERAASPTSVREGALTLVEQRDGASDDSPMLHTQHQPVCDRALLLQAYSYANLGSHEAATVCCRRLIQMCPFAIEPYELLATIAQEQKRYGEAKLLLKSALYLAPESARAYLELGALYHIEGDTIRARKMHLIALELLNKIPPGSTVGPFGGPTAHEWILHLKRLLAEGA